jgi:ABC-type sugar transport system ATPase subunit
VRAVSYAYGGVQALEDVTFELQAGRVQGLVGQNGAGKSTLIQILVGALRPLEGAVYVGEEDVSFASPAEAQGRGIAAVHQDAQLFPQMDVATNVYAIDHPLPRRRRLRSIDWVEIRRRTSEFLGELGIAIEPRRIVGSLSLAERKLVQIARAVALRPAFLILDEPTASLERRSSRAVLDLVERLREAGLAICFVSHRLDEVRAIADEITVLCDGRVVGKVPRGATEEQLIHLMLGSSTAWDEPKERDETRGDVALRVSDLLLRPEARPIALDLAAGEILGVTGLAGSGAEDLVRMIAGARPCPVELVVYGRRVRPRTPAEAIRAGIAFVPEDRQHEGVFGALSIAKNISMASLAGVSWFGLLRRRRLVERARSYVESMNIRTPSTSAPVSSLSGGNQQKVLAARCLSAGAKVLVLHEPTHGVDIGAIAQIHELLRDFATAGGSVIVASGEVRELLKLCHRIAVFRDGELVEILSPSQRESEVVLAGVRDAEELLDSLIEGAPSAATGS